MTNLAEKNCIHRPVGDSSLEQKEIAALLEQVPTWKLEKRGEMNSIVRKYSFRNFKDAMTLANQIAELADLQDHHPEMVVEWGNLRVQWWTHTVRGLSENDFIMAAKIDLMIEKQEGV
jgi:4a-hydroxytetrahydrobiopterin dehydratase